jgi:PAS domain S-box-containing protein
MRTNRKATTKRSDEQSKTNKGQRESRSQEKTTHESMANILERIGDGFVAFDAQMNYTYVNERSGELLGRKPESLIGKNYWKEYPEAQGTPFAEAYVRALKTQTPVFFEDYYAPWDRWFENRIYPSKDGLAVFFTEITERKRAEIQLQVSEERLERIVETIPDGIIIVNREGAITYANSSAERILGLTRATITERSYNDPKWKITSVDGGPFPDEDLPFSRVMKSNQAVYGVEHAIVYPDGRSIILSINATPMHDTKDELDGMVASVTDITERKHVEAMIKRESNFSNALIDSLPGVFYLYDEELRFLRWNKNLEKVSGYTGEEIAKMSPLDFFVGTERDLIAARIKIAFTTGIADAEASFITKDGKLTPYYFTGLRTQMDDKTCLIGVGVDITDRKRAEDELRESEEKFSKIFYASPVPVSISRMPDGGFIDVNESFLKRMGYQREEVIGRTALEIGMWVDAAERKEMMRIMREQGSLRNFEARFKTKTGEVGTTLLSREIIELGGKKHLVGTSIDITEIRRAEEEIRTLNQELEQRVIERTAQLQAANKELESFSYSVSHDLRAPLRAISGFAEIIARRHRASLNDEGQHYFDNIVQASERMGHLIDDLLNYARIGRVAVRRELISLRDVLALLKNDFSARLKEINGTLEVADDLPSVIGDRTLLNQIFTNLLENALTYRKPDIPLQINVTWQLESKAVIIRVSDNGIGIPVEHHRKIFNIFQRLHSEDDYPGTGIGLSTVKKSVELLGGKVWVESQPHEGSTFFVKLLKE